MAKVHKTRVCKILVIRQQRTVIPKDWETNDVSPVTGPVYSGEGFQAAE